MQKVLNLLGTQRQLTTSYHSQTNRLTKRFNTTLADMLSSYVNAKKDDWDLYIPYVQFAFNLTQQKSTETSPYFLVYGREPILPQDLVLKGFKPEAEHLTDLIKKMEKVVVQVNKLAEVKQKKQKKIYNKKHIRYQFRVGDKVLHKKGFADKGKKKEKLDT